MCTAVYMPDGRSLYSLAQLRAEGWTVAADDMDEGCQDDYCLCWVDVEAVLERAGVAYEENPFGYDVRT